MSSDPKIAIAILAAGNSSRLGQAKQLIIHKNQTLLERTIGIANDQVPWKDIYIILGGNAEEIQHKLNLKPKLIINPNWKKGLGNSIAFATKKISSKSNYDAICFLLTDQIFLSKTILNDLFSKYKGSSKTIVISSYTDGKGPPSIFDKKHFSQLMDLKGNEGAKTIVNQNLDELDSIHFPNGYIDIDLPSHLKRLMS